MLRSASPEPRRLLVVAYDIVDDRRRARVARALEGYGVRVQNSVFECFLGPTRFRELRDHLKRLVDPAEDAISFYRLCRACRPRVHRIGLSPPEPDTPYVIL